MFGPLEAITDAIGEGLTELCGFKKTRLSQPARAARRLFQAASVVDYDGGVIVRFGVQLPASVGPGQQLTVVSGPLAGAQAPIAERLGDTSLRLADTLGGAAFSSGSVEIDSPADTVLWVESALGWSNTACFTRGGATYRGRVVVDGRVYFYERAADGALRGVMHDDGTGQLTAGVAQDHAQLAEVDDFSRNTSALDAYRRSLFVQHAAHADLTVLGNNLAVPRPEAMSDDDHYRRLVQAMAYNPRGTVYGLQLVMEALLGEGRAQIFEDLTLGSAAVGQGHPQHGCAVFIAARGASNTDADRLFLGATWVDGAPLRADSDGAQLSLPTTQVGAVYSARDGAGRERFNRRLIGATLSDATLSATPSGQLTGTLGKAVSLRETQPNAHGGRARGCFQIAAQTPSSAQLVGPTTSGGSFTLRDRSWFVVEGSEPFSYPDDLGQAVEILSGPNAGVYTIEAVIDGGQPVAPPLAGVDIVTRANTVALSGALPAGGFVPQTEPVNWRKIPRGGGGAVVAELVAVGSASGGTLTLADPMTGPGPIEVKSSLAPSGYLTEPSQHNELATPPRGYTLYPAYLPDQLGHARQAADDLTAAGVLPQLDALIENNTGSHIRRS